jgi:6-phosphogluconolactonase
VANAISGTVNAYVLGFTENGGANPILQPISGINSFSVGSSPVAEAIDPGGRYLYVANQGSNNISAFAVDGTTGNLTSVAGSPFSAGAAPNGINVDTSGKFVMATNSQSNNISVFEILSHGQLQQISGSPFAAGNLPSGIGSNGTIH